MANLKELTLKIIWRFLQLFLPENSVQRTFSGEFFGNKYLLKLKFKDIVWCYSKGFLPKGYFVYNLSRNDYRKYLPQRNNIIGASINGTYSHVIGNKILFERHIKAIISDIPYLHVIDNLCFIENGVLQSLNDTVKTGNYDSLVPVLEKNDLILKPVTGSKGKGVYMLSKKGNQYNLDGRIMTLDKLISILSLLDNYLIQERFAQVGFSNEFNSRSLNTIRICTMIDPVSNEPFIPYAVHRFGSLESGYTDNFSQSGISALIDADGMLGKGRSLNAEGEIIVHEIHPVSKRLIYKEQIANWKNLTQSIIEMIRRMPYLKHVGWDFILSDGELYILEGNIGPGVNLLQIHQPLSEITSAWNFYRYYNFL